VRKLKIAAFVLLIIAVIFAAVFAFIYFFRPQKTGILVDTKPASEIYIDSEFHGKTPLEITRDPGDIVLRLIPESYEIPLIPYETKIHLEKGVKTIVHRDFAQTQENAAGEIISYEKISDKDSPVAVISYPDAAEINIDGNITGNAPFQSKDISPGDHTLKVNAVGYKERIIHFKTQKGYRLTVVAYLAKDQTNNNIENPSPSPTPIENQKQTVEILEVETGYVRVRKEPSTLSAEIGRVTPGKSYDFVEKDDKSGWYQIVFEEGKEGWVSNQYSKLQGSTNSSPTITAVPATKEQ
jgi:hypothetical protein